MYKDPPLGDPWGDGSLLPRPLSLRSLFSYSCSAKRVFIFFIFFSLKKIIGWKTKEIRPSLVLNVNN
jgi:hypothetical protein